MTYDGLRQILSVSNNNKIILYNFDFSGCFGSQVFNYCQDCGSDNTLNDCDECYTQYSFVPDSSTCLYSGSEKEKFALRDLKMVTCCPASDQFNLFKNQCLKCRKGYWADSTGACQLNPENCLFADDITGICTEAYPRFYLDS